MSLNPNEFYIFVIDMEDNINTGNFIGELCAYMTGIQGYDESYDEYIDLYHKEMNIAEDDYGHNEYIFQLPGEYGYSPCGQYGFNGIGIFMDRKPTDEEINILKERAKKFRLLASSKEILPIKGFRLIHRKAVENEIPIGL